MFILLIIKLTDTLKSRKAINFLLESDYNIKEATLKINKYIEIVDNYLIELKWGFVVDLSKYNNFQVLRHKARGLITKYFTLECFSKNENISVKLAKMNKQELDKLLNYLYSISKK